MPHPLLFLAFTLYYIAKSNLAIMDIDTLGWVFYPQTLKRVPAGVLSGLLTADILSTLDLLLLPKLPPIQYDCLIFINHKVHTNLFHGFAF